MLKPQYVGWLSIGVAGLVSCRTAPPQIQPISWPHALRPATAQTPPAAPAKPLPVIKTPATNGSSAWPSNWVNSWLPLADWAAFNGLDQPRQTADRPQPVFDVRTSHGILTVTANQQAIRWDGVACWLSYAPKVIAGQLCLHALDAQKTLQPLLHLGAPPCLTGRTIVIDPGHGGKDAGTQAASGYGHEKDLALDWALRVGRLLTAAGWTVVLTRTNDSNRSIPERVAVADQARADLFLSLHFNSGQPSQTLSGIETYCLTPVGLPSNLVHEGTDDPRQVFPNNAHDAMNLQWAFRLHAALVRETEAVDRGLRRARFLGVLRWQQRPAVLVEAGYLSHPAEARRIASAEYRQKLAEAVAKALNGAGKREA